MTYRYELQKRGSPRTTVLAEIDRHLSLDPPNARGYMTCYSMMGGNDVQDVVRDAYNKYFFRNALVRRYFPGYVQLETEVLSISAGILSGGVPGIVTSLTSGGTESIFCAVHAAREWARNVLPHVKAPEIVAPYSAHATLSKACHYLGVTLKRVDLRPDYRADPAAMEAAIGPNTIGLFGSAPCWPYGLFDPIPELAEIAAGHGLWMHVDACVGGFVSPFLERAGFSVPGWDFRIPGVTSMSADIGPIRIIET